MLEYSLEDARELLSRNVKNAQATLEEVKRDAASLRDKATITEV